jgi:uncharacterized membrane protein
MKTVDETIIRGGLEAVYRAASDVERWPEILSHYRWVRRLEDHASHAIVEMAAWRYFGPIPYPTWWVSEMIVDPERSEIRYRHIRGITRGMDVVWHLRETPEGIRATIVHEWDGPRWPLIGRPAASWIIGPVFIHHIASRTLDGIRRSVEGHDA